jgi:hypothetical protein
VFGASHRQLPMAIARRRGFVLLFLTYVATYGALSFPISKHLIAFRLFPEEPSHSDFALVP